MIGLSSNPNAIPILEKNQDKIDWSQLSYNPNAINLLEKNIDKIDWDYLSKNPNAIRLLEKNPNKINWRELTKNPNAIHILEKNINKIDLNNLVYNDNCIILLEKFSKKIKDKWIKKLDNKMRYFLENPNIFSYDYEKMKNNFLNKYGKELIETLYHPKNFYKFGKDYWNIDDLM